MRSSILPLLCSLCALCLVCAPAPARADAPEALLKAAHLAAPAFERYRDMHILRPALPLAVTDGISSEAVSPDGRPHLRSDLLVPAYHEAAPAYLAGLAPSSGEVIGMQLPSGSSGWHKSIIAFTGSAQPARYLCSVRAPGHALEHIALRNPAGLYEIASISDTPGAPSGGPAVYRIRESRLLDQLRRPDARQWLEAMLRGDRGLRLLVVRNDDTLSEPAAGDTLVLLIEGPAEGRAQHALICGWTAIPGAPSTGIGADDRRP